MTSKYIYWLSAALLIAAYALSACTTALPEPTDLPAQTAAPGDGNESQTPTFEPTETDEPTVAATASRAATAVPTPATPEVEPTATAEEAEPTATPGEEAPTDAALISAGEPLYAQNCAPCHGAQGGGGIGPAHAGNEFVLMDDPTEVIRTVLQGRGGMPSFADNLSNEQIAAVLSYLRNALGNSAPVVRPDDVAMLR